MIHARSDYQHIQDNTGKIANDEPVFLLRAKDALAPDTMRAWVEMLEEYGGDETAIKAIRKHIALMEEWQDKNGCKYPDTPPETVSV